MNLVFCGRKAISLNMQILVAFKTVTQYRLLFNHHLIEQLDILGNDLRKEKEKYLQEKKKADQSLRPTHLINTVLKHFNVLYTVS